MDAPSRRRGVRLAELAAVLAGAGILRLLAGVGFVNYDTLYGLAWGDQLARGETPAYGVPIAPTPHPLVELLGLVSAPLGPGSQRTLVVALAFLALSACGWAVYRLGCAWFGRATGALAALLLLTRVPVLSYGVRAYVDLPYLLLILCALLIESGRRRAGEPVLALLALAGLLRPEAWAFSGLYWLYLLWPLRSGERIARIRLVRLTAIALSAPVVWIASDLLVTGNPMWSLTNTRHTASTLDRKSGIANVPEYIPRRIGEILRPPVLLGAALGGVLSLLWLRRRAAIGAVAGIAAVVVFALFASVGLPINSRYAFLASAILCIFCGAGTFGWLRLPAGDRRRGWWMAAGGVVVVALLAYAPAQYRSANARKSELAAQQRIEDDLVALVRQGAVSLRCGPVGVPNHAPIPLLSLYLRASPARVVSLQYGHIGRGVYVDPADRLVETDYVLDPLDPHEPVSVPPGFRPAASNRSWRIYERCL